MFALKSTKMTSQRPSDNPNEKNFPGITSKNYKSTLPDLIISFFQLSSRFLQFSLLFVNCEDLNKLKSVHKIMLEATNESKQRTQYVKEIIHDNKFEIDKYKFAEIINNRFKDVGKNLNDVIKPTQNIPPNIQKIFLNTITRNDVQKNRPNRKSLGRANGSNDVSSDHPGPGSRRPILPLFYADSNRNYGMRNRDFRKHPKFETWGLGEQFTIVKGQFEGPHERFKNRRPNSTIPF